MIVRVHGDELPSLRLPRLPGLIVSGPREVRGDEVRVCPTFRPTGDASTVHARRAAVMVGMERQSLVIHAGTTAVRSSSVAFVAGRRLLDDLSLPGPVVTSADPLPPYAGDWRALPCTVLVTEPDGENRPQPVWELMSPARYAAWLRAGCP